MGPAVSTVHCRPGQHEQAPQFPLCSQIPFSIQLQGKELSVFLAGLSKLPRPYHFKYSSLVASMGTCSVLYLWVKMGHRFKDIQWTTTPEGFHRDQGPCVTACLLLQDLLTYSQERFLRLVLGWDLFPVGSFFPAPALFLQITFSLLKPTRLRALWKLRLVYSLEASC